MLPTLPWNDMQCNIGYKQKCPKALPVKQKHTNFLKIGGYYIQQKHMWAMYDNRMVFGAFNGGNVTI